MSGAKKGAKSLYKGVKNVTSKVVDPIMKGTKSLVDESLRPFKRGINAMTKPFVPKIPGQPDAPLMPDYESIEKDRRRRRTSKMGRTETIMSDTLG